MTRAEEAFFAEFGDYFYPPDILEVAKTDPEKAKRMRSVIGEPMMRDFEEAFEFCDKVDLPAEGVKVARSKGWKVRRIEKGFSVTTSAGYQIDFLAPTNVTRQVQLPQSRARESRARPSRRQGSRSGSSSSRDGPGEPDEPPLIPSPARAGRSVVPVGAP